MNGQGGAPNALDRMRSYVDDIERASPLAFVGRQAIMNDLMAAVRGTVKPAPTPGMTRVVQGVPGAGKAALCSEFIARHNGGIILWGMVECPRPPTWIVPMPRFAIFAVIAPLLCGCGSTPADSVDLDRGIVWKRAAESVSDSQSLGLRRARLGMEARA